MKIRVFENIDIADLSSDDFNTIRGEIPNSGVILIKNQKLDQDDLVTITKKFGEPVLLPEGLRFNNTHKSYPEIARISNILPDGTLLKNHKAAEYWHSDGDFWQPRKNYIFNFLFAEKVPQQGGQTGFVDLRMAYEKLSPKIKNEIEDLQIRVSCDEIPDFKDVKSEEKQPDAYHKVKHIHVESGKIGLYIGHCKASIHGVSKEKSDLIMNALVEAIENADVQYIHNWQPGDILIWDNTSVMHRGMGGYANYPRLLYRTQAFITPIRAEVES